LDVRSEREPEILERSVGQSMRVPASSSAGPKLTREDRDALALTLEPYMLTALIERPGRLVYLSSGCIAAERVR
jgi:hypothetical protein